ncbi:MAG: hypothetical protein KC897_08305 [Candidatus Omnitrophica bacterium]|nr:hypothetical protein [Candidatus Omnitrophota bacterium]MCB9721619.1 hypothetical protein [Candidatus Omnitrophota bacterium]
MDSKKSLTDIVGCCLVCAGLIVMVLLRYFDENHPHWGGTPLYSALLLMAAGFTAWRWEENNLRFNADSIPAPVHPQSDTTILSRWNLLGCGKTGNAAALRRQSAPRVVDPRRFVRTVPVSVQTQN